jgi:hypothetical protein
MEVKFLSRIRLLAFAQPSVQAMVSLGTAWMGATPPSVR